MNGTASGSRRPWETCVLRVTRNSTEGVSKVSQQPPQGRFAVIQLRDGKVILTTW